VSTDDGGRRIFVTGGSGYIGGRLVPRLIAAGHRVRCLARDPAKLTSRTWHDDPRVEIVAGDVANEDALAESMRGCHAAYYLVHSMLAVGKAYRAHDRALAETFAHAAGRAGVKRIIYLGGLGETGANLSTHLTSRRETEAALAAGGVPVTTLRAAIIIGSGSASFEILRYLVERLPIMITPRWVHTECQPIAVRDVLHYLVACLDQPATVGRAIDIGGPEVRNYRDLMQTMAAALGLRRRLIIPVPVLTPRLSALWIHLITPLSARIALPLADGLRNRVVCRNDDARRLMPHEPLPIADAIERAVGKQSAGTVETSWHDAGPIPGDPDWAGGKVFTDQRSAAVAAPTDAVYAAFAQIGGDRGYYAADWLWHLRGTMDHLVGGPGLRRGRRHPTQIAYGEALDFWRVTDVVPGRRLELRAEMKLPGVATLTFEVEPSEGENATLTQTALFKPRGLLGLAYWYAVQPLHHFVFQGMLNGIRTAAEVDPSPRPMQPAGGPR
jgi:uncharacterized protein YbjT (DUF2867 family)